MKISKIYVLAVFLLLFVSGCRFPFSDKQITIPFLEKDPEKVLDMMAENMFKQVDSYNYEVNTDIRAETDDIEYEKGSGDKPANTKETRISSIKHTIKGRFQETDNGKTNIDQDMEAEISMDETISFKLGLKTKLVGEKVFLKIGKLPKTVEMFIPEKGLEGWIMLTPSSTEQNFLSDIDPLLKEDSIEEAKHLIKDITKEMKTIVADNGFLRSVNRLADEEIDGFNCYHYQVKLKKSSIEKLKKLWIRKMNEAMAAQEINGSDELLNELEPVLDSWQEALENAEGEVWIDKKAFYLRKFKTDIALDSTSLDEFMKGNDQPADDLALGTFNIDISISQRFFDFDQAGDIKEPKEYYGLDQIIQEVIIPLRATDNGPELQTPDTDGDGLDDTAEAVFGTDPKNPDTDGDGYPDGSEVKNGYNPAGEGDLDDFYLEQMGTKTEVFSL